MDEKKKHHLIKEYFLAPEPLHSKKVALISLLGLLIGFIGVAPKEPELGNGIIIISALVFLIFPIGKVERNSENHNLQIRCGWLRHYFLKNRYRKRPSYQQMQQWLQQGIHQIVMESTNALDIISNTHHPILVIGPVHWSTYGLNNSDILRHYQHDKQAYFYSTYTVTVFQFTDSFFGVYQTTYNMIKQTHVGAMTRELFYRDVVEVIVSTDATNYSLMEGDRLEHAKAFFLTVSSGDAIKVLINDPVLVKAGEEIESMGDSAVKNIRAMLRTYKT